MTDMHRSDETEPENVALRERLSRLSQASMRINESLDLETVLQGALDSARSLTGARYGVITLLDDTGRIQDFLSSGMTAEEATRLWKTPDAMPMFEHLGNLSKPLRIPDLLGLLGQLGFPEFRPPVPVDDDAVSFLAAPVLHRGQRVANIFVAGRQEGREFTLEDEETLVMFAAQAALVIANARRYREEQRVRNDLETLINTSPVGVVVFDASTGQAVSFNREALRIVDGLRSPEQSPQELLDSLTIRRDDGREVALAELPLARLMSAGETVRAEEMTLLARDGRSVATLVNATPVRGELGESDAGKVESYVVTLQDMTPLEEQERLRADFLAMVSHELRMPLTSIKGSAATVLTSSASMERAEILQFFRIIDFQADRMHDLIGSLLDVARIETGTLSVDPKPVDASSLAQEAKQAFIKEGGRKGVEIDMPVDLLWVMADRGRVLQVLGNLLSNAARHSPADSPIRVTATREGSHVAVSVADEGMEVSADLLPRLFRRSSPADGGDLGSGATPGLGLAICRGIVEAHGGRIRAESDGPGVRFTFTLPTVEVGETVGPLGSAVSPSPSSGERTPILVVDDDPQALRHLRDTLSRAGYLPIVSADPGDVPRLMEEHRPRLVLLDVLLPGGDGVDLMHTILETADVPVILLSDYGEETLISRAFDMGAADYVVKPFSPTELRARIRTALRRPTVVGWAGPEPYSAGDLSIDYAQRQVTVAGRPVQLTATEYDVLHRLSTAAGRVLTHDQLLQWVWSPERKGEAWLVRNVVKRLRSKLGDDAENPVYIFTEPRVGYRMAKADESTESAPQDATSAV